MPHLDAKALETDPNGMTFLRDVLTSAQKPAAGQSEPGRDRADRKRRRRAKSCSASPPTQAPQDDR